MAATPQIIFYKETNVPYNNLWKILGSILTVCSLALAFVLFYEYFFDRATYLNKKNLLKYLESDAPKKVVNRTLFDSLFSREITIRDNLKILIYENNKYCVFGNFGILVTDQSLSLQTILINRKIRAKIKELILYNSI